LSRIREIQALVRNGLYYLTEHADDEAMADGLNTFDIEYGILHGKSVGLGHEKKSMKSLAAS